MFFRTYKNTHTYIIDTNYGNKRDTNKIDANDKNKTDTNKSDTNDTNDCDEFDTNDSDAIKRFLILGPSMTSLLF